MGLLMTYEHGTSSHQRLRKVSIARRLGGFGTGGDSDSKHFSMEARSCR